ncbi:unnamed protein product, partial [Staurois parvus]
PLTSVWTVLIGPVLITCTLPRKINLPIPTKVSMCRVTPHDMCYQEIREGHWKKGRIREERIKQPF